jgi:hypothetical protein
VGFCVITAHEGMNLSGMPLVPMVATPASLEAILGAQLTGANNEGAADRVWVWNGSNYEIAWLVEGTGTGFDGTWFTGGGPTGITLQEDQGFWVQVRQGHGSTDIVLLGEISYADRSVPVDVGMNLLSPSSLAGVPLGDKGSGDSNLWESGATGANNEGDADRLWNWTGSTYQFHWLVDGVGPQFDGLWFRGGAPSTLWIEPGNGNWVQVREGHSPFDWACPGRRFREGSFLFKAVDIVQDPFNCLLNAVIRQALLNFVKDTYTPIYLPSQDQYPTWLTLPIPLLGNIDVYAHLENGQLVLDPIEVTDIVIPEVVPPGELRDLIEALGLNCTINSVMAEGTTTVFTEDYVSLAIHLSAFDIDFLWPFCVLNPGPTCTMDVIMDGHR